MASKALQTVKGFLSKIPGLKPPWKVTGPASSVEFLEAVGPATEYRKRSPGSQLYRARVPQATPDTVYDIQYYTRDVRREGQLVGGTHRKHKVTYEVDPAAKNEQLAALGAPPTMGQPFRWGKRKSLLEYENNGYT